MESGNLFISITHGEYGPLLSSARVLVGVKLEAIERADTDVRQGVGSAAELERHELELGDVQALVDQLERLAGSPRRGSRLTGRRALLDEIVLSALAVEAQELADSIVELEPTGDLREIATRLEIVRRLVTTLARVRS